MRTLSLLGFAAFFGASSIAYADVMCSRSRTSNCFVGQFGLAENPADSRTRLLAHDFAYVDPRGIGWQTNKGDVTNGASIPRLFQRIIGSPWDERFIRAAVVHDRYCDKENERRVRPWRDTHRMFHDALVISEVSKTKAKLMYYAVYVFGPKWGYLHRSTPCSLVDFCIQDTDGGYWEMEYRDDQYDSDRAAVEIEAIRHFIDGYPTEDGPTLEELETIAEALHPQNAFWRAPQERPVWRGDPLVRQ